MTDQDDWSFHARGFSFRSDGTGVRFQIANEKSNVFMDRQVVEDVAMALVARIRKLAFVNPESSYMVEALSEFQRRHGEDGGIRWHDVAPLRSGKEGES